MISTMPEDTRHSRRRTMLFSVCIMWMRRATHVLLPIDPNGISQWSAFGWWTGTRNCCRGSLIETSGHVPGHQSVLVRLPKTGAIVLPIDAVPFGEGFTRDEQDDGSNPDAEAIRASTIKLLDLVEREHIGLVIFGHDKEQWEGLKKLPEYYE